MIRFTCNLCGGRSERMCSPRALKRGSVFAQCQHCEKWVSAPCMSEVFMHATVPSSSTERTPSAQHTVTDHLNIADEYRKGPDGQWIK